VRADQFVELRLSGPRVVLLVVKALQVLGEKPDVVSNSRAKYVSVVVDPNLAAHTKGKWHVATDDVLSVFTEQNQVFVEKGNPSAF